VLHSAQMSVIAFSLSRLTTVATIAGRLDALEGEIARMQLDHLARQL